MSVGDCIGKLIASGSITKAAGDSALDLHKRMQREFTREAPPASADVAAALATAKALRESAAAKVRNIHAQVNSMRDGEQRAAEHPMGKMAGIFGMITRDLWRDAKAFQDLPAESLVKQGPNVEGKYKATVATLYQKFAAGMEAFKPDFKGATERQLTGTDNMIRELKGVETGDKVAKDAAKGFAAARDYAVARVQQAGKIFSPLEDWNIPQFWRNWRVKEIGLDEFKRDIIEAHDTRAMEIFNRDTNAPVGAAPASKNADPRQLGFKFEDKSAPGTREAMLRERDFVINRAYQDITNNGGGNAPFSNDHRTFNFAQGSAGAEAYLRLQKKYGPGTNIMQMLTGHLDRMAHEIALTEVFGPNYEANFRALFKQAKADEAKSTLGFRIPNIPRVAGAERFNPARLVAALMENKGTVEGAWKVATGQVHPVHDTFTTSMLGALRNMNVASKLGQAIVPVALTDSVTSLLAADHLGMGGIGHMARVFSGGVSKADAQHLNIQAHNIMDFVNGIRDYDNHISLMQATGKFASGVVKATGLDLWGQAGKRTWAGDMLNLFASQGGKKFDKLEPAFRRYLDSYGFTEADWNKLRDPALQSNLRGAKYLDPTALQNADRGLYERVMNSIQEQSAFAMHQPDFRLRGIESGASFGINSGVGAEVARGLFQFKTFALSRMTTQMMRIFTDGPIENRVMRGLAFAGLSTAAGAAAIQAQSIINLKDPGRMDTTHFWAHAFQKGGVGGYYGDLVDAALRGQQSGGDAIVGAFGPVVGVAADAMRLAASPIHEEFDEDQKHRPSTLGRQAVRTARGMSPKVWYAQGAVDRLFWDKLQTLVDPDYRKSWSRAERVLEKETGATHWWPRGASLPERAPDMGNVLGR